LEQKKTKKKKKRRRRRRRRRWRRKKKEWDFALSIEGANGYRYSKVQVEMQ